MCLCGLLAAMRRMYISSRICCTNGSCIAFSFDVQHFLNLDSEQTCCVWPHPFVQSVWQGKQVVSHHRSHTQYCCAVKKPFMADQRSLRGNEERSHHTFELHENIDPQKLNDLSRTPLVHPEKQTIYIFEYWWIQSFTWSRSKLN